MSLVAVIPAANILSANASLQAQGFGPDSFSVPAYSGSAASFAVLHSWTDGGLLTALNAIPGVLTDTSAGNPGARVSALVATQGASWLGQATDLPTSGNAVAGSLYRYTDDSLWWCIQTFDRTTSPLPPAIYPALIRRARIPGEVGPWGQPLDQFDAYQLVNAFTGLPDQVTHQGQLWVSQYANNVWEPGVFGWALFEETP